MAQNEEEIWIRGPAEYRFAIGAAAVLGENGLYLDFFQRIAHGENPTGAVSVARLVLPPTALDGLIDELSRVRDEGADSPSDVESPDA